jgi:3alpha(or 20beta)-hydroxysteroid dehydrogenase
MFEEMGLTGKVAIVTGGARGLGAAIARAFAEAGARVAIGDILEDQGEKTARALEGEKLTATFLRLDVSDDAGWGSFVAAVRARYGRIDILVNNAGIALRHSVMNTSPEDWQRSLGVNLTGAFLGTRHVVPFMREAGGGAIVNISSTSGIVGSYDAGYSATKWGLRGFTKTSSLEFSRWGIRVNSVHPGTVPTEIANNAPPNHYDAWLKMIPMNRVGLAREIADAVRFLASDQASYITGTELVVDGGLTSSGLHTMRSRLAKTLA